MNEKDAIGPNTIAQGAPMMAPMRRTMGSLRIASGDAMDDSRIAAVSAPTSAPTNAEATIIPPTTATTRFVRNGSSS
jgi:hypothetical protein